MSVTYQAENWIEFSYAFLDQDKQPIDISNLASVTLYLYMPVRTVKTAVGAYSATADRNLVVATAKDILNTDLGPVLSKEAKDVRWQFLVILSSAAEPVWSPIFTLSMTMNLTDPDL